MCVVFDWHANGWMCIGALLVRPQCRLTVIYLYIKPNRTVTVCTWWQWSNAIDQYILELLLMFNDIAIFCEWRRTNEKTNLNNLLLICFNIFISIVLLYNKIQNFCLIDSMCARMVCDLFDSPLYPLLAHSHGLWVVVDIPERFELNQKTGEKKIFHRSVTRSSLIRSSRLV